MPRFFTAYWRSEPWEVHAFQPVAHAASNDFVRPGVASGDRLYIVHFESRETFLGAALTVGRVATRAEAADALGMGEHEIWDARDHVLAEPGTTERLDPDRVIPRDVLRALTFLRADGTETALAFDADGAANQQTFRTVRELTSTSATLLDTLIDWGSAPRAAQVMSIALRRGACNGTCPVYEVAFWRDGHADWVGHSFVDRVGACVGTAPADDIARIFDAAIGEGFFTLDDEYPPAGTDLPDYTIQVATGARDTMVRAWGGSEPARFKSLADQMDELANSISWQPASG